MSVVSWREESERGAWTQLTWRPSALAGLVECVWLFDGTLSRRERYYPTGELDLIVQLDTPFRIIEGQPAAACPSSSLAGLIVAPLVIESPAARSRVLGVRLRPAGAFSLFGVPLHELTGTTLDLGDLAGGEARRLAERLDEAGSDRARLLLLGRWIAGRLAGRRSTDPSVAYAVSEIERAGGKVPIASILRRIDVSPKRFTRLFEEQVGVRPKLFARILRFRELTAALRAGADSFSQAALAHGYYDQSHMNAEFREFAGMTPGQFLAATSYPESLSLAD
ncbi:helix-turn-helix domain-containing protein [Antribacter gilvus]|uniref:helix-turn-helix domain-containing protein n=1 Tax=Antribacter gilvus TaxID=2304675 RepID=UPI000F7B3146|nr:helix-turn-helix domain-containing protein [Antribacter gilvus]